MADEDLAPSEILARLQIQAIYRQSTGNRLFHFFGRAAFGKSGLFCRNSISRWRALRCGPWDLQQIGFVLPKSAFARLRPPSPFGLRRTGPSGYGGQALRASADRSAQPGEGRDGAPWVAARRRGGRDVQRIECLDR